VTFEGTLGPGSALTLAGSYTMGAAGGTLLPGGQPIIYSILGHALTQGDVDCDGVAGVFDSIKVQLHVAGNPLTQEEPCPDIGQEVASFWGDVDCDNIVGIFDAIKIQQYLVGQTPAQEPGCTAIGAPVIIAT
ncbi:MAG TPA: hypothetical protein VNL15_02595, partial [Dehalococcoidia bacterium]|nr:hypothetical protein [Dehalococcoidia bacterium]